MPCDAVALEFGPDAEDVALRSGVDAVDELMPELFVEAALEFAPPAVPVT